MPESVLMDGKIKLLHVIGSFLYGGTERLMLDILSRLPQDVFDTTACCIANTQSPDVSRSFQEAGIRTEIFRHGPGPRLVAALARYVRRERFHIVHTHHNGNLYGRLAAVLARTPIIMTYQHNWPGDEKAQHRLAFRLLDPWTCRNITVSEAVRRYDIQHIGVPPAKVITVYNGIDTNVFRPPTDEERFETKRRLALRPDAAVVGVVGRLVDWKRFDLFVQAAARISASRQDVDFLVAGDGEMRQSLQQLAYLLNVGNHVRFLGWRSDMPQIFRAMDIFCTTSDSGGKSMSLYGGEGFGLVSAEAMASGLPVVAVDTEVNREVITAECGLFCQPESEDIAAKVFQLLADPGLRASLGQVGRARAASQFDVARAARQLSDIYRQAMVESCYGAIPGPCSSSRSGED